MFSRLHIASGDAAKMVEDGYLASPYPGVGIRFYRYSDSPFELLIVWISRGDAPKGSGAEALKKITSLADKYKVTLNLQVFPGAMKILLNYYKQFGFTQIGRSLDMVRKPR